MRAVRYLLRVSVLMLVGVAVFCGLVLLLNAQVLLNRYAELYMMDAEASFSPILNRHNGASNSEPATLPAATGDPERPGNIPAPLAGFLNTGRAAIHVDDAERITSVAAADRWVDVILTHRPETGSAFSEAVLENVKVLAIESVNGGDRAAVHAVTLDVDSETVENLLLASRSGRLSLVLHRPVDKRSLGVRQAVSAATTESPPYVPDARPTMSVEVAASASVPAPDVAPAAMPEVADAPPADAPVANALAAEHFKVITINRVGGQSSIHRVPRER